MGLIDFFLPMKFKSSAVTDKGKVRAQNQDAIYADDKQKLYIVADGIGGHGHGEYASQESIKLFCQLLFDKDFEPGQLNENQMSLIDFEDASDIGQDKYPQLHRLYFALHQTNQNIHEENKRLQKESADGEKFRGMGTTFSGCWFLPAEKRVILFNIGDSRIYLLRNNKMVQRTHDHSLRQHWLDHGQQGEPPPKNIILKAIGPKPQIEPDIEVANICRGDTWMICSDGLHGMLEDNEIQHFILQRIADRKLRNYQNFAPRLLDKANYAGGLDNISVILIHIS